MQFLNEKDKRNDLQSLKNTPISLESTKEIFCKLAFISLTEDRLQLINSQFSKKTLDKLESEKSQSINLQSKYSPLSKGFSL